MASSGERFGFPNEDPLSREGLEQPVTQDMLMGWFAAGTPTVKQEHEAGSARAEALKILDKDAFKLGDLNPLIHATDLTRKESVDSVSHWQLKQN